MTVLLSHLFFFPSLFSFLLISFFFVVFFPPTLLCPGPRCYRFEEIIPVVFHIVPYFYHIRQFGQNWAAARSHLVNLYGSSDRKPRISAYRLRKWARIHADTGSIAKLQGVDRYNREFMAQSTPLWSAHSTSLLTTNEANLLF